MEIIVAEYLRGLLRSRVSFLFMRDPSLSRIDKFLLGRCKEIRKFFGFYLVYNSPDPIGYF